LCLFSLPLVDRSVRCIVCCGFVTVIVVVIVVAVAVVAVVVIVVVVEA